MFIDYAAQNRKGRTLWFMRGPISSNYVETDAREVMFPPETGRMRVDLGLIQQKYRTVFLFAEGNGEFTEGTPWEMQVSTGYIPREQAWETFMNYARML